MSTYRGPSLFGPTMPLPIVDHDTRPFWDGCNDHRLLIQRCTACAEYRFAPSPLCWNCHSFSDEWVASCGLGEIYSWTSVVRSVHEATADATPYNVVIVQLDDCGGAKLVSNVVELGHLSIAAGMRVSVVWDDMTPEISLPRFRPIRNESAM